MVKSWSETGLQIIQNILLITSELGGGCAFAERFVIFDPYYFIDVSVCYFGFHRSVCLLSHSLSL